MTDEPTVTMTEERPGKSETVKEFAPYAVIMIVWAVTVLDHSMNDAAKTMGANLFSAMLMLVNPAKEFARRVRTKKDTSK